MVRIIIEAQRMQNHATHRRRCMHKHTQAHTHTHTRAVASSPAMARPVFATGTKILNIHDMHVKHFQIWGGAGLRLNNVLKAEWSCYSVAGLSLNKE